MFLHNKIEKKSIQINKERKGKTMREFMKETFRLMRLILDRTVHSSTRQHEKTLILVSAFIEKGKERSMG